MHRSELGTSLFDLLTSRFDTDLDSLTPPGPWYWIIPLLLLSLVLNFQSAPGFHDLLVNC